jgi:hypothetical protein
MATKLPGKNLFVRVPKETAASLDHIANCVGVKTTQLVNMLVYANEKFNCGTFFELRNPVGKRPRGTQELVLRLGPYAQQIAIAGAKRSQTFAGSWIKHLLIQKTKEWEEGKNVFNGGELSENQLIPKRSAG